jgi:hypothetical protein
MNFLKVSRINTYRAAGAANYFSAIRRQRIFKDKGTLCRLSVPHPKRSLRRWASHAASLKQECDLGLEENRFLRLTKSVISVSSYVR